jgi:hypothetical protein
MVTCRPRLTKQENVVEGTRLPCCNIFSQKKHETTRPVRNSRSAWSHVCSAEVHVDCSIPQGPDGIVRIARHWYNGWQRVPYEIHNLGNRSRVSRLVAEAAATCPNEVEWNGEGMCIRRMPCRKDEEEDRAHICCRVDLSRLLDHDVPCSSQQRHLRRRGHAVRSACR